MRRVRDILALAKKKLYWDNNKKSLSNRSKPENKDSVCTGIKFFSEVKEEKGISASKLPVPTT